MKILNLIWKFLNSKLFICIIVGILAFLFINTCSKKRFLKDELERADQNTLALNDTIVQVRLKNGELQASKHGFIASEKELKKVNNALYKEVKAQKGKVITLNKLVMKLQQDSTELSNYINELESTTETVEVDDSTYNLNWKLVYNYSLNNYDIFKGRTAVRLKGDTSCFKNVQLIQSNTTLLNRETQIDLTYGQKYEKGKVKVYVQSSYPGFTATSLEGVYVDYPRKKRWLTGFSISLGIMPGYDIINKKGSIFVGPTIGYTIFQW